MTVERDEAGKFKESTDAKMNAWVIQQIRNKPSARLMRRLFDQDAAARRNQEANNGD